MMHPQACSLLAALAAALQKLDVTMRLFCRCLCCVFCYAVLELQGGSNLELLLKEATEAYKLGDYSRALLLCQPVSMGGGQE